MNSLYEEVDTNNKVSNKSSSIKSTSKQVCTYNFSLLLFTLLSLEFYFWLIRILAPNFICVDKKMWNPVLLKNTSNLGTRVSLWVNILK